MSKGSKNGSNQPCTRPDLRERSEEELKAVLDEHRMWLETDREGGDPPADLSHADLRHADLKGADLREANLRGACLAGVDLRSTDFREADLRECDLSAAKMDRCHLNRADLRGADLTGATLTKVDFADTKMREATFRDADLTDAIDLMQDQLAATDLTRATLPEGFEKFEGLEQVTEISKQARAVFLSSIAACVFSWLTIATTTDVALILNSSTTPLPIIQTKVPIAGFYWAAPLVLLALYVYLHLYLHNLWARLAALPAIFQDGETLDQKAYPWLLAGVARAHVPIIREDRPVYSRLQVFISIVCAWALVPLTIFLFWGRYLPRHEWFWTGWLILLLAVSLRFGLDSYRTAALTLRGREWRGSDHHKGFKRLWRRLSTSMPRPIPAIVVPALVARLCVMLAAIAIMGNPHVLPETAARFLIANLKKAELSIKSEQWRRQAEVSGKKLPPVKSVDLRGRNLRYANAKYAFLARAILEGADLRGAILEGADLREAHLTNASLQHAKLNAANLQHAKLGWAKLQYAKLKFANLQHANLTEANLQHANLGWAKLETAYLGGANLTNAHLGLANLQNADLQNASLTAAKLHWANLQNADLQNADLTAAKLPYANLKNVDLTEAYLENASLCRANLENANLQNACLLGANGLTPAQLGKACGNKDTRLPEYLPKDYKMKRCFDEEKVYSILRGHIKWLESGGKHGTKADFSAMNLRWFPFSETDLRQADFGHANLTGAYFFLAHLQGADFEATVLQAADLSWAKLKGANLKAADLRGARDLTQKQLDQACGDENTQLPDGLTIKQCPEKRDKPAPPKTAP